MKAKKIILTILILLLLITLAPRITASAAKLIVHEGMTYGTVKLILGSEGKSVGAGLIIYEWEFVDGSFMTIWFETPVPGEGGIPLGKFKACRIEITEESLFPNQLTEGG